MWSLTDELVTNRCADGKGGSERCNIVGFENGGRGQNQGMRVASRC